MAYYLDNSKDSLYIDTSWHQRYAEIYAKNQYESQETVAWMNMGLNLGLGCLGMILAGTVKSPDDNGNDNTVDNDPKRTALEKARDEALAKLNIDDESQINEAYTKAQNEYQQTINKAQKDHDNSIKKVDDAISACQTKVTNLGNEINTLKGQLIQPTAGQELTPEQNAKNKSIESKIQKLQQELEQKNAELGNLGNKREATVAEEDKKLAETQKTAEAALQIVKADVDAAIAAAQALKDYLTVGDNKVDVKEKTEALHEFTTTRDKFMSEKDPSQKKAYALKLKELYEANPNDKTLCKAYEKMLEKQVNECLK